MWRKSRTTTTKRMPRTRRALSSFTTQRERSKTQRCATPTQMRSLLSKSAHSLTSALHSHTLPSPAPGLQKDVPAREAELRRSKEHAQKCLQIRDDCKEKVRLAKEEKADADAAKISSAKDDKEAEDLQQGESPSPPPSPPSPTADTPKAKVRLVHPNLAPTPNPSPRLNPSPNPNTTRVG